MRDDNIYLFPRREESSTPLRSSDVLKTFAESCGAERPELLKSTKLRKDVATMCQLLDLQPNEMEALATFMGHSIDVHRNFYRLQDSTFQLAKLSKIFLRMEEGNLRNVQGKTLETIPVRHVGADSDHIESGDENAVESVDINKGSDKAGNDSQDLFTNNAEVQQDDFPPPRQRKNTNRKRKGKVEEEHGPGKRRRKQSVQRMEWTTQEINILEKLFKENIDQEKNPIQQECLDAQKKAPILQKRPWSSIKFKVKYLCTSKKSYLQKMTTS